MLASVVCKFLWHAGLRRTNPRVQMPARVCSTKTHMLWWLQLVEENLGQVQESSAEELLGCIQRLQALKKQNKAVPTSKI